MSKSDFHKRLAVHLGGTFARLIENRLEEIGVAVAGEQRQASFSVTAEFKPVGKSENPDGDLYKISMKPRLRTPDEAIDINLKMVDGQLSLYEKDEHAEAVGDELAQQGEGGEATSATH